MKSIRVLALLPLLALPLAVHAGPLGDYNVLVSGSFTSSGSDVEGKLVAGGNVTLSGYSAGLTLPSGPQDALLSGGTVNFNSGSVYGNAVATGAINLTNVNYANGGQSMPNDPNVATTIANQIALDTAISQNLAGRAANGTWVLQYGGITFTGTDPVLNVFSLTSAQFSSGIYYNFNLPAGSTAVFNITGASVTFANTGYGFDPTRAIWNLPNATALNVSSLNGSILAPNAAINGNYGAINGQVFAASFHGPTQLNSRPFVGTVPEPATLAVLGLGALGLRRRRKA